MNLRSGRYTGHWMTNLGEPAYPPELWEHIFSFLPGYSICRIRLVCRRWKEIVDSSVELLGRLRVNLERLEEADDFFMDRHFVLPALLPVVNIALDNWDILALNWWPNVCRKLRVVSLFRCKVDMQLLLEMIRQAPQLECLQMRALWVRVEGAVLFDFCRPGMRQLWLDGVHFDGMGDMDMMHMFVVLFPRLRDLALRNPTKLGVLVWAVRQYYQTLERLDVIPQFAEESLLPEICRLRLPRLKRLSFDAREPFEKEDWSRLLQVQPLLDELIIDVDRSSILLDIAKTTTAITALSLYVTRPISMTFLNQFPQLRSLEINGYTAQRYAPLILGGPETEPVSCLNLRVFRLFQMMFIGLLEFFALCPQVETIMLDDVKLEELILAPSPPTATFPNLRSLDVSGCFFLKTLLIHIFANSPLLERVRITHTIEVDDEVIRVLCTKAKRLRKLELEQCLALSDASGGYIIDYCTALEELRLYRNFLSPAMMTRLRRTRSIRIWCSYYAVPLDIDVLEM